MNDQMTRFQPLFDGSLSVSVSVQGRFADIQDPKTGQKVRHFPPGVKEELRRK